jgi:acetyl-CoA carboxylase biotin carboxyl carrier protein
VSELTHEDVKKILQILDEMGDREVRLEIGELKLHVNPRGAASAAPAAQQQPAAAVADKAAGLPQPPRVRSAAVFDAPRGQVAVRAPTIGTFYRASSPGAPPFVQVGDRVAANDTVCMFEVMKLFSSLPAGADGTIAAILVENEAQVEQDQVLMLIAPDA